MIWCVTFNRPIASAIRDKLLETAYLMMRSRQKQKKFRAKCAEGVVKTQFKTIEMAGTTGMKFQATVENEMGTNEIVYMVRCRDLALIEEVEGLRDLSNGNRRPNPIRRLAQRN